jgi:phosphoribosyl 1,2-cyclic phosphodiesterase
MRLKNLGSGSGGNATLIHADGHPGECLMVDCGMGIRELERRVEAAGKQPQDIRGIFITHEHGDHAGCAESWSRKYDCPVLLSRGTWHGLKDPQFGGGMQFVRDGEHYPFHGLDLRPFTVPHDAREPLQLRIADRDVHLGILTDLGHVTPHVIESLLGVHTLILECNHDPDMLRTGRYPPSLKKRVGGDWGHLTNAQAGAVLQRVWHRSMHQLIAAHLSEANNTPELVLNTLVQALPEDHDTTLIVAAPDTGTDWIDVGLAVQST